MAAKTAHILFHQKIEINRFLRSNDSVTRTNYLRIIAVASIDLLIILPFTLVQFGVLMRQINLELGTPPFYSGWKAVHSDWAPLTFTFQSWAAGSVFDEFAFYWGDWAAPAQAFIIFALFGVTSEARASYWRAFRTTCGWVGWKLPESPSQRSSGPGLGTIEFGERPIGDISLGSGIRYVFCERKGDSTDALHSGHRAL